MAVAVVDRLEAIEIGEDEAEIAVEALRARDLLLEALLERPPVGEPRERVDQGLLLDDRVQLGVLERDGGLRREQRGGLRLVVVERPGEHDLSEQVTGDRERQLELPRVRVGVADTRELAR